MQLFHRDVVFKRMKLIMEKFDHLKRERERERSLRLN